MKFIHFADSHLDGFKDDRLNKLSNDCFRKLVDDAINNNVDFVLMSGDLFNTALPRVDTLKFAVEELKRLKDNKIPVYAIPGSHDFSPRGRSMFEVLEKGGFLTNVMVGSVEDGVLHLRLTIDEKTGAIITGIMGKKGMLDKDYYERVVVDDFPDDKFSIFLFHTAISEMRPSSLEKMEAYPVSFLPGGFDYYAGGHVHIRKRYEEANHKSVVYPGPTFPNSFSELEELGFGSYVFFDSEKIFDDSGKNFRFVKLPSKEVVSRTFDLSNLKPESVSDFVIDKLSNEDLGNKIVLLRFEGLLSEGRTSDVGFNDILRFCYDEGSFVVLKNTYKLRSRNFDLEDNSKFSLSENIEEETIKEFLSSEENNNKLFDEKTISLLLEELDLEPEDGEKKSSFNERVVELVKDILENDSSEDRSK